MHVCKIDFVYSGPFHWELRLFSTYRSRFATPMVYDTAENTNDLDSSSSV